jgi:HEAT repeat protein
VTRCCGALAAVAIAAAFSGCGDRSPESRRLALALDRLSQQDPQVRVEAARELGEMRDPRAVERLIRLVSDIRPDVRQAAVDALGAIGDKRAVPVLREQLTQGDWRNRQSAAQGLGGMQDAVAVPDLEKALNDENASVAVAAARALFRCGAEGAQRLRSVAGSRSASAGAREAALATLAESVGSSAASVALEAAADTNSAVRAAAYLALGRMGGAVAASNLVDALRDSAPSAAQAAERALLGMDPETTAMGMSGAFAGTNVLQQMVLLKLLERDNSDRSLAVLSAALVSSQPRVRSRAADVFQDRTRRRASHLPALVLPAEPITRALDAKDPDVRSQAAQLLETHCNVGPAVVAAAAGLLADADPGVRAACVRILRRAGSADALRGVAPLLADRDLQVRLEAAFALAPTGDEAAVAQLAGAIDAWAGDPEAFTAKRGQPSVHALAMQAIGALGASRRKSAVPPLLKALNLPSEGLASAALGGIRQVGDPAAFDAVAPLLNRNTWGEHDIRSGAIGTLAALDPKRASDLLVAALAKPGWQAESCVTTLCRELGRLREPRAADLMIDRLREQYADAAGKMDFVKQAAAAGLLAMGDVAVPALIARLNDKSIREGAIAVILGRIGVAALKPLIEGLRSPDTEVRRGSAWAIGNMGHQAAAVEPLAAALSDPKPSVRAASAWAIGAMQGKAAAARIHPLLKDADAKVRLAACEALGRLSDASAVPGLVERLGDESEDVCFAAVLALGLIGDRAAVGPLSELSKTTKDDKLRYAVSEALSAMGTGSGK